ncbi:MAG: NB-ARC domain-containing protein [Kibdelosporangium sp.]
MGRRMMADGLGELNQAAEEAAFGRLLLRYRRSAGLSQSELAAASGMSVRALRELEHGRAQAAQQRSAEVLADALGLTARQRDSFLLLAKESRRRTARVTAATASAALPPSLADLTGRTEELDWLLAEASAGGVVAVVGQPGVGKTALAVLAAHALSARFQDGCLAVDLRGMDDRPVPAQFALDGLLRALGVPAGQIPGAEDEQSNLLRMLAESKRILLLLDNAANEAQVRPLLLTGPGCLTLVTCRQALAGLDSARRLWLEPLAGPDAVGLLARIVGADRVDQEPAEARELVGMCGCLPLAVRIAGNRLATRPHWTLAHLVAQLRDERARLGSLSVGDLQVRSAFDVSYRRLSPAARIVFRRLAVVPGPDFGAELAAVAVGTPFEAVGSYLEELVDASLLQATSVPGRFQFHDLIRIFAGERLEAEETPDARPRYRDTVLGHLLLTATAAARMFLPATPQPAGTTLFSARNDAAAWLSAEKPNWTAAQRVAAGLGWHREVVNLAQAMHWLSDARIPDRPWDQIFELGLASARALGSRADEAKLLNQLGWALYMCLGELEAALAAHTESLTIAEEVGDRMEQAMAHIFIAFALGRLGRLAHVREHARRAEELALELGFFALRMSMRNVRGVILQAEGRYEEASQIHRSALEGLRERGDQTELSLRWMKVVVFNDVGLCHAALGRWRQAAAAHREARLNFAILGIGYRVARSALLEAIAWRQADEHGQARECLELALEFFTGPLYQADRDRALAELALLPEDG